MPTCKFFLREAGSLLFLNRVLCSSLTTRATLYSLVGSSFSYDTLCFLQNLGSPIRSACKIHKSDVTKGKGCYAYILGLKKFLYLTELWGLHAS